MFDEVRLRNGFFKKDFWVQITRGNVIRLTNARPIAINHHRDIGYFPSKNTNVIQHVSFKRLRPVYQRVSMEELNDGVKG